MSQDSSEPSNTTEGSAMQPDADTWSLIDFVLPYNEAELVSDALWMRGVVAIEEREGDGTFITLRTSMGEDPTSLIEHITDAFPHVSVEIVHIPRSIADTWRQFASPTKVNESVTLVPAWLPAPSDTQSIFIEPLDTFGLGNHPTTVLALRLALKHIPTTSVVFDLGSGSGVLAIGLAKFLQCSVTAYDIADSAQEALLLNASLNQVETVEWRDGIQGSISDCVVANILAPVLIAESVAISKAVRNGGYVILSGMRDEQVDGVVEHYADFASLDSDTLDGWTAVVLQKNR